MFEGMIEKILKKFKYVQEVETDKDLFQKQYQAEKIYTYDLIECSRKQQEEINALKADKDRMESLLAYTISNMHMIFGIGGGRHINLTEQELQDAAGMQIEVKDAFPISGISIYSVKR